MCEVVRHTILLEKAGVAMHMYADEKLKKSVTICCEKCSQRVPEESDASYR